jgi:hypothetical protein
LPAKADRGGRRDEGVRMEAIEKMRLADFGVLEQAEACVWGAKSPRAMENCGLASRKVASECILNCPGKLKMEIPNSARNSRIGSSMR